MKAGLILVMFGFIQYQIIMPFSIFRSLKKLVAFHVSKYIYILLLNFSKGYTHEIYKGNYAHFNIEPYKSLSLYCHRYECYKQYAN